MCLKGLESYQEFFSDHSGMKLEVKYKKKTGNFTNMWRLNNLLLSNQWVKEEIKREIKCLETNENGNTTYQNFWYETKNISKREVHNNKCLHQEAKKISNNLTLHSKEQEKEQTKSKVNRWK